MKNRVAEVNAVLKAMGRPERLTAGRGYYYWRNGADWPSVYIYRASDLTLAQWLDEIKRNMSREGGWEA